MAHVHHSAVGNCHRMSIWSSRDVPPSVSLLGDRAWIASLEDGITALVCRSGLIAGVTLAALNPDPDPHT